ncbi:MAG: pyrroline-5-carboxylate reductase [Chloroflexi bacterium]|nr:MAG: pyrroline-5-carboxylate reductase [Chloroflexota bacterium]
MLTDTRLAFIGSGNMAEAMIKGVLDQELVTPDQIIASGPREERGRELAERYGVYTTTDNFRAADVVDVIVLSVKPQVLPGVLNEIRGAVDAHNLILSIVAGARIKAIAQRLGHQAIVRSMPNTPAQIGEGITVWTDTPAVTEEQRAQARGLLGALGEEVYVEDEGYLDMATALSGTGPAYVFLFMEALIDAGVHLGFSRHLSERLVLQTMRGAVDFARQSNLHPAQLRNMVTSPGGTSAEALYQLEKGGMRTVVSRAVWAAYQKSKYLGDLSEAEANNDHSGEHRNELELR